MNATRLRLIKLSRALAVFRERPARPPRAVAPPIVVPQLLPGSAYLKLNGKKVEFYDESTPGGCL